jgi:hypothetical protein
VVPNSIKVPVPWDYVAPHGALCLGVEPATDFDKRGQADDQIRDKETGERFGGSKEFRVKVVAAQQPVPPTSLVPGYPPMVEFDGVTLTPYVDSQKCKGAAAKCRARQAWSIRATAMTAPQSAGKTAKAA